MSTKYVLPAVTFLYFLDLSTTAYFLTLLNIINRYKRIGYSLDIMRQTACLVVNPIIVDGYASLFNCMTAVRASDSMTASS